MFSNAGHDSAVRGFTAWGNDASRKADLTDRRYFDGAWDQIERDDMATAAGVAFIPVCGWDEILRNWRNGPPHAPKDPKDNYGNYPCNS
jgi:hypothetical protein